MENKFLTLSWYYQDFIFKRKWMAESVILIFLTTWNLGLICFIHSLITQKNTGY